MVSGCASAPPTVETCTIINRDVAHCTSTDSSIPSYDKPITSMRGFKAFSPEDMAELKKWIRKQLDQAAEFLMQE